MSNSYTDENGGTKEVSGTTKSRWHISADTRNTLALFVGAVTLLACVWGVCEYSISRLSDRFDRIDARFDEQDRKQDHTNARLDRLEAKVDRIETLLLDYLLRIDVPGEESTPKPAVRPAGRGEGPSQDLVAKPVAPWTGAARGVGSPSDGSRRSDSKGAVLQTGRGISFGERGVPREL